ncbi:hypothetical protein CR513_17890, partial [Mucuna pruriens]
MISNLSTPCCDENSTSLGPIIKRSLHSFPFLAFFVPNIIQNEKKSLPCQFFFQSSMNHF